MQAGRYRRSPQKLKVGTVLEGSVSEIPELLRHHTADLQAQELYLKGRFHIFRMTRRE
ncbi:MAG: hypothetical protein JO319_18660 [Acidobacteriaceae bacterium]|nr:hypothetical protein [Acidobacteriaceae bacterium]